jgi:hypothetical protein
MTNGQNAVNVELSSPQEFNPRYNEPGLNCSSMVTIPEHRSGWNYVTQLCHDHLHNPNGYNFVDFVEKVWCWNRSSDETAPKGIFFENESHFVDPNEIKYINGREYAILPDERCVYWDGEKWVRSALPLDVVKTADAYGVFTVPWVGVIHNPVNMPKWFDFCNSPQELLKSPKFQASLRHCKGLIVFSEHLKRELLSWGGWPCTIEVVYHPTESSEVKWNLVVEKPKSQLMCFSSTACHNKAPRKLVQVGYWLRRISSIWQVDVPENWRKYWVNRAEYGFKCLEKEIFNENLIKPILSNNVDVLNLSNDEYDAFLSGSVMFVDLYDSSCNNTIIEAIVRHIPIVVRRLPATVEYLGEDYCLFFDYLEEVEYMLTDDTLLIKANKQLRALEQSRRFYGDHFVRRMRELPFLNPGEKIRTDTVISLGVDCLPRAMSTKFHFKRTKKQNELTYPFDLAWHDYETTCRLIRYDFDEYTNPLKLYVNSNGHIAHRDYTIVFNHESDSADKLLEFARDDFLKFRERYDRRVNDFRNVMATTTDHVVFLLHYKKYPVELVDAIKDRYPELRFTILTINCPYAHESYLDQPTNVETDVDRYLFYTIRKPSEDYLWYETPFDEDWEKCIESVYDRHLFKLNLNTS